MAKVSQLSPKSLTPKWYCHQYITAHCCRSCRPLHYSRPSCLMSPAPSRPMYTSSPLNRITLQKTPLHILQWYVIRSPTHINILVRAASRPPVSHALLASALDRELGISYLIIAKLGRLKCLNICTYCIIGYTMINSSKKRRKQKNLSSRVYPLKPLMQEATGEL